MCVFKATKIHLVVGNKLLAEVYRSIHCIRWFEHLLLEYVLKVTLGLSIHYNLFLQTFHRKGAIVF